jgi:hypothetical protein
VFCVIGHFDLAKSNTQRYQWSEEFIVIACNIDHTGAAFGMAHDASHHIGMALFPTPFILLNFPSVDYVTYQVQGFAGVIFEKVVESFGLAVTST